MKSSAKQLILIVLIFFCMCPAGAAEFERLPVAWKWLDYGRIAFGKDISFKDSYTIDMPSGKRTDGVSCPPRYVKFPFEPSGAQNLTFSPDSSMMAFTRGGDLFVADIATHEERQLTFDGNELISNGYASWVYYEEILGRPSRYKAFWWSDDSRTLAFYRFDNSLVPMFPIYSPKGQDGSLNRTRYPKAGEPNPRVRIGFADVSGKSPLVWADFDEDDDQYFGIPFWGADGGFFISREPRLQNTLDLYRVDPQNGSKTHIYHETYPTWLDWIEGMVFGKKGLYMVRSFETGWQQAYYLSYDGKEFRRLTSGPNWRMEILRVDERKGDIYFKANRDASTRAALYKADAKGRIRPLTDVALNAEKIVFSPDGKYFAAQLSNYTTPSQVRVFKTGEPDGILVADLAGKDYDASRYSLPFHVSITTDDGLVLPGCMYLPKDFDPSRKYPVHVDIYGGPDIPVVKERWIHPGKANQWWAENGIIQLYADCRAAGHNGRRGLDCIYRQLDVAETGDFVQWGKWLQSLPYVNPSKIGVQGFSFGGTMTSLLVMRHSDVFHYGVAGGGVYDWALYDTHYTERFMDTPQANPEGYRKARVLEYISEYPVSYGSGVSVEPVMLKITHGTADDNVHFQNALQMADSLQKAGKKFEFMVYPDALHGYRGYQSRHFEEANREFWSKYLLER